MKYLIAVVCLFFSLPVSASVQTKRAEIWGRPIEYQRVVLKNNKVDYDGKSFVVKQGEETINRVVINTAFFEKEADAIWKNFERKKGGIHHSPDLMTFLNRLQSGDHHSLLADLLELKEQLEWAAWHPLYEEIRRGEENETKARKTFVRRFRETRMKTVEWHELSHLLDEMGGIKKEEREAQATEVKAFLTELVYGDNPQDSFWQVVATVASEIRKGENIDYSLNKLQGVLEAVCQMPWYVQGEKVCFLCYLSKERSAEVALWAYRNYSHQS